MTRDVCAAPDSSYRLNGPEQFTSKQSGQNGLERNVVTIAGKEQPDASMSRRSRSLTAALALRHEWPAPMAHQTASINPREKTRGLARRTRLCPQSKELRPQA